MARCALPRPVEILLARARVAGLQIRDIHAAPPSHLRFGFLFLIVDERHQRRQFRIGNRESRHAFFRPAFANNRRDFVASLIALHQFRARQIRPVFASARIAAMTESALLEK